MKIDVRGVSTYLYTGGKKLAPEAVRQQPVVIFIHGAQQDHSCWTLQSRWFAHHGYAVLVPDLPGHGRSAGEPLSSVEAIADWVIALLDALAVEQAAMVGHSMGSLVALELAARHAKRVSKVALVGSSLPMPVSEALLAATRDNEPKAVAMINEWSYSASGQFGGSAVPGLWLLGMNQRLMERQRKGVFHTDMKACNDYARAPESLSGIALPILIISGSKDKMTSPKVAKLLQSHIPAARFIGIEGSGHALMAERPDAVLDALIGFMPGPAPQ